MTANLRFRTDINGVRAIAVCAVLVYHFAASYLPGGFVGVDVFFVISGFLMTSIIYTKIEQSKFSFIDFYLARFRRIVPPLLTLCIVLSIFGWFFFPPEYFQSMHKHVAGSLSFISNILYMRESGYFDGGSQEKWLLHTWSLSVEWQFYIIYPLFLLALSKFLRVNNVKIAILVLTLISFAFCIHYTSTNAKAAFYLLPTRAWEMLLGSIAYFYPIRLNSSMAKKVQYTGLSVVLFSYIFINHNMIWPGYWPIIPTFGTLLILVANYQKSFLNNNFFIQKLGKSSYSIYLWHWPIAVIFFNMDWVDSVGYLFAGVLFSILLGWLAYYIIEVKLSETLGRKVSTPTLIVTVTLFLFSSFVYIKGDTYSRLAGSPMNDIRPSPLRETCNVLRGQYKDPNESCEYFGESITWATLGDSHSIEVAYALAKRLEKYNIGLRQYSASACPPLFNINTNLNACAKWSSNSLEDLINTKEIENIVIAYRYSSFLFGDNIDTYPDIPNNKPVYIEDLSASQARKKVLTVLFDTINELSKFKKHVYVVLPIPELYENINKLALRKALSSEKQSLEGDITATSTDYYFRRHEYFFSELKKVQFSKNVVFIDPRESLCKVEYCYSFINGKPLYFDDDHLSLVGASRIADQIFRTYELKGEVKNQKTKLTLK